MIDRQSGNAAAVAQQDLVGSCFRIPAEVGRIEGLREGSRFLLQEAGLGREGIDCWELVLTEAFVNAVRHGANGVASAIIEVEWRFFPERVVLEVRDPGRGVPAGLQGQPALPEDPLQEGGRGLYLIKEMSDAISHWVSPAGHQLRVEKRHPGFNPKRAMEVVFDSTMEELSASYESLAAFYRLGEAMVQADHVTTFIRSAVGDLRKLVPADYFSMVWCREVEDALWIDLNRMEGSIEPAPESMLLESVTGNGGSFVFESQSEVEGDPLFSNFSTGCILPVQAAGRTLGTLNLGRHADGAAFKAKDLHTLRTYADLFGIAVAHANNALARTREQQALREIEIAAALQETLVPAAAPASNADFSLFLRRLSARSVSGDYTEGFELADGRLLLVIADVMGKGVSAAFLAGMLRTAVRLITTLETDLAVLLDRLNFILCQLVGDLPLFATAAFALFDTDRRGVWLANAGHCPVILGREGEVVHLAEPSGPPLGLFPEENYNAERVELAAGDWLLMVTDGIYEWEIRENEIWGWEPLINFAREHAALGGEELWNRLQTFRSGHGVESQLEDDQTLIYYQRKR